MGNSDSTCGSGGGAERRRNRTDTRPPGNREARVRSSSLSHSVFQPEGTLAAGGRVGKRGPSPRSGAGALEGATLPGPAVPPQPLPEARTPGAQVWPGRQVQSALVSGRCPPTRPPLGLVLPPTFVYSSATAMGRQGSSRAAEMRGSGAGRAARRPSGRQRSCRPNKLQPDHAVGEVFQQPRNFPECWRRGRKGVPDWPFPAHLARPRCDWRDGDCGRGAPPPRRFPRLSGSTWRSQESAQPRTSPLGIRWLSKQEKGVFQSVPDQVLASLGLCVLNGKSIGYNYLHRKSRRTTRTC